jgi:hypothetical protein
MEYLKNDICNFTPLFDIDYNNKINIISCSLFKMPSGGYKNFDKYLNGLAKLNEHVKKYMNNYKIRLFIDNSIYKDKKIFSLIKTYNYVQIILYSCPNFVINNDYHIGLFGTIVRFFPMFDFDNNDANIILFSDTDSISFIQIYNTITILQDNNKIDGLFFVKNGSVAKTTAYNCDILYKNIFKIYSMSTSCASLKKINKIVLLNYFDDVSTNTVTKFSYLYKITPDAKTNTKFKSEYKNFIYGVDEYFLNNTLNNYLIDNNIPHAIHTKWFIFDNIYWIFALRQIYPFTKEQINLLNILFDYLLIENKYNKETKLNFFNKFKFIDKYFSTHKPNSIFVIYKLYEAFVYLINNKLYKFLYPSSYYDLFLNEKYFGVYDFEEIIFYKSPYSNIIIKNKTFNDKEILNLKETLKKAKNMTSAKKIK